MIDTRKIIQALCFLLNDIPENQADKIKLVKLLFLSDKCHLIRYGRTISDDDFWVMPRGVVGSVTKDVLEFDENNENYPDDPEYEYARKMLQKVGDHSYRANYACDIDNVDQLSETDIEALRLIAKHFGHLSGWDLVRLTHRYPEWEQYKELFESGEIKREKLDTEELLSAFPDGPFSMPNEHVEESRDILSGFSS
ncbi:MAG: Panacea domain-containing protein [Deltaproteobacteria bacterium]|nr:Panacea domain-containing protein [Deltaproteobacteria bacterium]